MKKGKLIHAYSSKANGTTFSSKNKWSNYIIIECWLEILNLEVENHKIVLVILFMN